MKITADFNIVSNEKIADNFALLTLTPSNGLQCPQIAAGQFTQIRISDSPTTFLRRPISICDFNPDANTISLLVRNAGEGTRHLIELQPNAIVNLILPLGNGFNVDSSKYQKPLLIGGGVGIAPLHHLAKEFKKEGVTPTFLIGARSKHLLLMLESLSQLGDVHITTDDGSAGHKGVVTTHPFLDKGNYDAIFCCGPAPMMKAVAKFAKAKNIECEVSLENMMACGIGACLCCVENTVKGNVCVCTEGPVFNITDLTW